MKKITLIGDSIRLIGYGKTVEDYFKNKGYEVFQTEDNCRFAKYALRMLFDFGDKIKGSEVIHWNCGLWDIPKLFGDGTFSSFEEYKETIMRITKLLKTMGKTIIFATTTPVRNDNPYNDNGDIIEFNKKIVPFLKEEGVIINDLHALVYSDIDGYIREDDKIHLTEKGIEACAKQVIKSIESNLV